MSQHTSGQWQTCPKDQSWEPVVQTDSGLWIAKCSSYQNARRIVACVNACAGITNNALELGSVGDWGTLVCDLEEQRSELLAALYAALPIVEDAEKDPAYKTGYVGKVIAQIHAAIAKAEAK